MKPVFFIGGSSREEYAAQPQNEAYYETESAVVHIRDSESCRRTPACGKRQTPLTLYRFTRQVLPVFFIGGSSREEYAAQPQNEAYYVKNFGLSDIYQIACALKIPLMSSRFSAK